MRCGAARAPPRPSPARRLASLLLASARALGFSSAGADDRPRAPRPSARPAQHRTSALHFSHAELDPALARSKDRARRRVLLGEAEENATPDDPASAYATHPLHGSVREHGYYYADVALGVPPRTFQLIVDTGSTLTYVPCASCGAACGRHTGAPPYDPEASATHEPVDCRSDACVHGRCSRNGSHQCVYNRGYAEHSSVEGHVVKDVIHLGGDLGNLTVAFGCTTRETGGIHDQVADGLMGLGHGADALPAQIAASRGSPNAFSLCYGSFEGGGAITLGRLPPGGEAVPALAYTPLVPNPAHPGYYVVETETWAFERFAGGGGAGETVAIAAGGDFSAGYGTVLDSGTTFTYAPTKVFDAFVATLDGLVGVDENDGDGGRPRLERVPGPDPNYPGDVCYKKKTRADDDSSAPLSTSTLEESFPRLALAFGGGASLSVPPSNYLFAHGRTEGAFCLGVMDNGDAGTPSAASRRATSSLSTTSKRPRRTAREGRPRRRKLRRRAEEPRGRTRGGRSGRRETTRTRGATKGAKGDEGAKGDGGEAPAEAPSGDDENDADETAPTKTTPTKTTPKRPPKRPPRRPPNPPKPRRPRRRRGCLRLRVRVRGRGPRGRRQERCRAEAEAGRASAAPTTTRTTTSKRRPPGPPPAPRLPLGALVVRRARRDVRFRRRRDVDRPPRVERRRRRRVLGFIFPRRGVELRRVRVRAERDGPRGGSGDARERERRHERRRPRVGGGDGAEGRGEGAGRGGARERDVPRVVERDQGARGGPAEGRVRQIRTRRRSQAEARRRGASPFAQKNVALLASDGSSCVRVERTNILLVSHRR